MLLINLEKILENTNSPNPHILAGRIGMQGHGIYKYADPSRVKGIFLETLSNIVDVIATEKDISPLDVTMGDIFDWLA